MAKRKATTVAPQAKKKAAKKKAAGKSATSQLGSVLSFRWLKKIISR